MRLHLAHNGIVIIADCEMFERVAGDANLTRSGDVLKHRKSSRERGRTVIQ